MRKFNIILLIVSFTVAFLFFTDCKIKERLYVYCWTYYIPDSVIEQFETEYNVDVKVDNYSSNEEMFAKIMAGAKG